MLKVLFKTLFCSWNRRQCLILEILALRQQRMVLERQSKKTKFTEADRIFWVVFLGVPQKGFARLIFLTNSLSSAATFGCPGPRRSHFLAQNLLNRRFCH